MRLRALGVGAVVAALIGTVVAGASVSAAPALATTAAPSVSRLAGADRVGTAVAISQQAFPAAFTSGGSVYLARMDVFADAVAAGTLTDGPVLLVPSCGTVPKVVTDEVTRIAPARVVALGGPGAVCDQVLTDVAATRTTARLAGVDRYLTSLEIARERARQGSVTEVYVASGLDSPDAVVGGQLTRGPILLTGTVDRSVDYNIFIDEIDPAQVIALGGPGAVSDAQLALLHGPKARLAGNSRYETAAAIAHHQFPAIADAVYLARGDVFADAVAAGALKDGPVVLVASCALPFAAQTRVARALPLRVVGLGGQGAVCDDVLKAAAVAGTSTEARISPVMPDQMGTLILGQDELDLGGTGRFAAVAGPGTSAPAATNGIYVVDRETGARELVSLNSAGVPLPDGKAGHPSISDDGRYVAFDTSEDDLGMQDSNQRPDVYVRDRVSGTTTLVSRSLSGGAGEASSEMPQISGDGRSILLASFSGDLVSGDTNAEADLFVADVATGKLRLATARSDGGPANMGAVFGTLSRTGQFVVFASSASDILPGGIDGKSAYVRDLVTGEVERVSTKPDGTPIEVTVNTRPGISDDGRVVVFETRQQALADDTDNAQDVYVKDREAGTLELASRVDPFPDHNEFSDFATLSGDGRHVAFLTHIDANLDPGTGLEPRLHLVDRTTGSTRSLITDLNGTQGPWVEFTGPRVSSDASVVAFLGYPFDPTTSTTGGQGRAAFAWERVNSR